MVRAGIRLVPFRDHAGRVFCDRALLARSNPAWGVKTAGAVHGLSLRSSKYKREDRDRIRLRLQLIGGFDRELTKAGDLHTFEAEDQTFLERFTLIVSDGRFEPVFHPRLST